jgi:hypothetical protein
MSSCFSLICAQTMWRQWPHGSVTHSELFMSSRQIAQTALTSAPRVASMSSRVERHMWRSSLTSTCSSTKLARKSTISLSIGGVPVRCTKSEIATGRIALNSAGALNTFPQMLAAGPCSHTTHRQGADLWYSVRVPNACVSTFAERPRPAISVCVFTPKGNCLATFLLATTS